MTAHMEWASKSLDLNPIERMWDQVVRAISRRSMHRRRDLAPTVMSEWEYGMQSHKLISRLIRSLRSRSEQVIAAAGGGGATKY